MIAERTRDNIAAARRKGKWTGGPVPFGYGFREKRLVVNEAEALVVREAFQMVLQHRQAARVAHALNAKKYFPRASRFNSRRGPRWTKDSVGRILRNPIYAGFIVYGTETHAGEHPAIIEQAVFEQAQEVLGQARRTCRYHGMNAAYVLRGLLVCARCRRAMTPGSTRKGLREHRYYRCATRDKHGDCSASPVAAGAIEQYVVKQLVEATDGGALGQAVGPALECRLQARREQLTEVAKALPRAVAVLSARIKELGQHRDGVGDMDPDVFEAELRAAIEALADRQRELADTERELESLAGADVEAEWVANALRDFGTVWETLDMANRGRLLRALLEKVVVDAAAGEIELHMVDFGWSAHKVTDPGQPKAAE